MRKTLLAAALAGPFLLPTIAGAQNAPAQDAAASAAPASPHTLTANINLITDYRFRGISQTFKQPALQGGIDYSHASGFYLGNWNSNVSEVTGYPEGNLEMDFYGGWKGSWGDWGLDAGALYYYYPGTNSGAGINYSPANKGVIHSGAVNNKELYLGGSWKFLSLKYYHSVGDYFSTPDTKNSHYLDLSASYDLGGGWGINGHVGHLNFRNFTDGSYTDWKLGVTKDLSGWLLGASYVDTNAKGDAGQPYRYIKAGSGNSIDAGSGTLLFSVGRTF